MTTSNLNYLKQLSFFSDFLDEELTALSKQAFIKRYPQNTIILTVNEKSDSIYFVQSGQAKSFITNHKGKQVTLNEFHTDDVFGELAAICDVPRTASIRTITACELLVIEKEDFTFFYKKNLKASNKILEHLAANMLKVTNDIESFALNNVQERIFKVLSSKASQSNVGDQTVYITHSELANITACSRETVTRALHQLTKIGSINQVDKNCIKINTSL